jgi:molybdopterin converting factor small subunit
MQVTVHYLAQLRRAAGCALERLDVAPGATVGDLFRQVAGDRGELFQTLLLSEDSRPHPSLLVFVGEQAAAVSHVLCDGDEVTILTPMAGGAPPDGWRT